MRGKLPKSLVAGDLVIGDISISCAVLEDETRLVSQRGVDAALGKANPTKKGDIEVLPSFVRVKELEPFIDETFITSKLSQIRYIPPHGGNPALGLKAELLPQVCDIWIRADKAGALNERQKQIAERAYLLMKGFAHIGIIALVDEATGYQNLRAKKALANILKKFLANEVREWTKTFPVEFYKQIFRLRGWNWNELPDGKKPPTPALVGKLTNQLVYDRLAPGILNELEQRNPKDEKGHRLVKHHQWFNPEFGHPKLKEHIAGVIALMRISNNWGQLERSVKRAFHKVEDQIDAPFDEDSG